MDIDLDFIRLPNVFEQSILASGPFINKAEASQLEKVKPSTFLKLYNNKTVLTTKACLNKLKKLVDVVKEKWQQKYALILANGYMPQKSAYLLDNSLHYEGRALDIQLKERRSSKKLEDAAKQKTKDDKIHHRLAWLAYYKAGFNFARPKKTFYGELLHVSCRRDR
ncbi:tiggy-winkle hedgehog protein-like [Hydractinia symbiolongicarpus]|uniref:tiggy-winkle hedgehog protein-like n=1 Tax=Hydractinia symbiolongicarpus TaxID=13093 RepID=UPI00254B6BC9|nr:tiggy-winkle hedgehog protein-like [Hydractinia symbiolongicarpus]XP_057293885.1 tiggy-winkle hedgehog protein-like [Hydractinia symbiolongicarpus]XP_057293886.1 tiggy-winkle hedgehog protein-like [Hydractinia symbiolongicarpus]